MDDQKNKSKVVLLSEDVRNTVKNTGNGQIDLMRMCKDYSDPYLLRDKKAVFADLNQDEFIGIFDYGTHHYFLSLQQLARFGEFLKLRLQNLLALMIKNEWEKYYSQHINLDILDKPSLDVKLKDMKLVSDYLPGFNPSKDSIFKQVNDISHLEIDTKSRKDINMLIDDMIKEKSFMCENSFINKCYPDKEGNEAQMLANATELQKNTYHKLKTLWKKKQADLGDKLLFLEKKKKSNQNWEDNYFRTFGHHEYKIALLKQKEEKYCMVLELKKSNPLLTFKNALKQALEKLTETEMEILRIKNCYSRSQNYLQGFPDTGGREVSPEELADYEQAIEELLVKLLFVLHTDTCPFPNLTEQQKQSMSKLWMELMNSKKEIYSYSTGMLTFTFPDYQRLYYILLKACKIFNVKVEDLEMGDRLELMIKKGTPIERVIKFLENDIHNHMLHLTNLEIIEEEYTNEGKAEQYRYGLENIEEQNSKLLKEMHDLSDKIIEIKSSIKKVFNKKVKEKINS